MKSERWLGAGLLLVLAAQLFYGLWTDGMTDDESVYIGAGYRHLHGDFEINPEQPPLAKMLGALPLLALRPARPAELPGDDQCGWAYRFFHQANRDLPLLAWARVPIVFLTIGLAFLLWLWAREAGGSGAGLLALVIVTFHPAILAHGHLVTTDLAAAFWMLLASWLYWRFLRQPSLGGAAGVALALSAAVLTRLTAGVLAPVFVVLGLAELARSGDRAVTFRWLATGAMACLLVFPLATCVVYALHPQTFVEAVRFQIDHNARGHHAYVLGDRGRTGWWYYYLVVLLVKNTPGFLALMATAFVASRGRAPGLAARWHWITPALVILAFSSVGRIQIGERYILAFYVYVILWTATSCAGLLSSTRGRLWLGALLLVHVAPALWIAPRGALTYFNPLAGGPTGGHRFLADSNLDWGQDLPRLAAWMRRKGVARVQLGYFGADDPDRYGIAHEDLPAWHTHHPAHAPSAPFRGTVVVSPNLLLGYLVPPGQNPYEFLLARPPDDRAGVYFVYYLDRP